MLILENFCGYYCYYCYQNYYLKLKMICLKIFDNYWKLEDLVGDICLFENNMMAQGLAIFGKK